MAALTDSLPLASSSRRIIDPGDNGPSWLQGVAGTLAKGVNAIGQQMDASEADRRRATADAAKAREDSARNEAAGLAIDHALGRGVFAPETAPMVPEPTPVDQALPSYIPFDAELAGPPPREVTTSIDEAGRARAAEEQGRAPAGSGRIVMERALMRLLADFPDQRANILKEFRENGFDHYLMRERDTEEALYDAEVSGTIKMRQDYVDAAVRVGAVMPGTDLNTAAAVGQGLANQEFLLKRRKEEDEAIRAAAAEGRTQFNFNQERLDREVTTNFQAGLSAAIAPSLNSLTNLFTQSNGDQTVLQLIPETLNALDMVANNWVTAAMQQGAPPATITAMRETWAANRTHIVDLVNGPGSEVGVASAVLKGMETQLSVNMMQALPVMYAMKDLFGLDGLERAFGDNPATMIPPETLESIKREIHGINGAVDTAGERVSIASIAQMLRGELQINELTEAEARVQIPNMVNAARGHVNAIAKGDGNVQAYVNANLQITNAAMELQAGQSNARSEAVVTNNIYDTTSRNADLALIQRDPTAGQILIEGKRGAAMHMLQNINNDSWRQHPTDTRDGLWAVTYNPNNGTYFTEIRPENYERWAARQRQPLAPGAPGYMTGMGGSGAPSIDALRRQGPPTGLSDRIGSINLLTSYLVATNPHDDNFRGVDATEARRFFIEGVTPRAMRQRQEQNAETGATLPTQIEAFRRQLDTTRVDSVQAMANEVGRREVENTPPPTGELQNKVKAAAEQFGLEWSDINRLVSKESGWRAGARNGVTNAAGLFQINDDIERTVDENIQQGLSMFRDAKQGAERILGRAATAADAYVMYQQGAGGGAALLTPSNASKSAEDVLTAVYGNAATARQAITANGGNLNMTAAQFAQHIRNYFNR